MKKLLRKRRGRRRRENTKVTNSIKRKEKRNKEAQNNLDFEVEERLVKRLRKGKISLADYNEQMSKIEVGYEAITSKNIKAILPNTKRTNF